MIRGCEQRRCYRTERCCKAARAGETGDACSRSADAQSNRCSLRHRLSQPQLIFTLGEREDAAGCKPWSPTWPRRHGQPLSTRVMEWSNGVWRPALRTDHARAARGETVAGWIDAPPTGGLARPPGGSVACR
jgi:hypothetical protein